MLGLSYKYERNLIKTTPRTNPVFEVVGVVVVIGKVDDMVILPHRLGLAIASRRHRRGAEGMLEGEVKARALGRILGAVKRRLVACDR
jgi:hypothetical protein